MFKQMNTKKPQDRARAAERLRTEIDKSVAVAIAEFVDKRDIANLCEAIAQQLRVQHATTTPIR
jgi:hypothetical protein